MHFNRPETPKNVPSHDASIRPHLIHVPWIHATQHFKLHIDRFSRFYRRAMRGIAIVILSVCLLRSRTVIKHVNVLRK